MIIGESLGYAPVANHITHIWLLGRIVLLPQQVLPAAAEPLNSNANYQGDHGGGGTIR